MKQEDDLSDESSQNSISSLRFNLSYYGADYPVDSLVKRMIEGEFIFPNFQRQYVWRIEEASAFIESLLLGLPVPSIFLSKDKYSRKLIVIDGQQRLRTLQYFFEGQFPNGKIFKLKNVYPQINGLTYQDLSSQDRMNLENTIIHCLIISENENSDSIYYLFERLNTTGTPLTSQEIRNAIYHGPLNEFLIEASQSTEWKSLYHKVDNRLEDQELILRFLALHFGIDQYKGSMVEFLNQFMLHNRAFEVHNKNEVERVFFGTMKSVLQSIGEDAFYYKKQFNISVYETICLSISINKLFGFSNDAIKHLYEHLLNNEEFWQMSKNATTSKKSLHSRLELAYSILKSK